MKTLRVRYLTTGRGPSYRHDEGEVAELAEPRARELVAAGIAAFVDPPEPESEPKAPAVPETAELRAPEQATAPPQRRVAPSRRPAEHASESKREG